MDFLIAIFAGVFVLGVLKELIPLIIQLADKILLAILRAPFRWLAHRWQSRAQLTPYQRGLRRASEGAFLAAACIYAATWFPVFLGRGLDNLAGNFWRAPADHPGVAVFLAVVGLGVIWVFIGMREARGGERDVMGALWSTAIAGACLAALWWQWLPSWPGRTYETLLILAAVKGFYIATAAAGVVRFTLSVQLPGNALRVVERLLQQRNAPLVGARRRFLFW